MKYELYSQQTDQRIAAWGQFNRNEVKVAIVNHLKAHINDTVEYEIDGRLVDFYELRHGHVMRCVIKGDREFFKKLT